MKPDVSIIIVNYCSAGLVTEAVRSIIRETKDVSYEIIIVDNASSDDSAEKLDALDNNVRLIIADQNLGYGKANNLGAANANGEYLFLLNPDTILMNNGAKILWDYLKKHPEAGVAGANLYSVDQKPVPSFCMEFDTIRSERRKASWISILSRKVKDKSAKIISHKKAYKNSFNYSDKEKKVAYVFGAAMMIPKRVFNETGGFDPDFFMYAEEEELEWRITGKGYSIVSVPEAKIIHLEGATLKRDSRFNSRAFSLRMNGTMTYYLKRYGIQGVQAFFHFRSVYYRRLIKLAKIRRKDSDRVAAVKMKKLLRTEYQEFMNTYDERG